MKEGGDSDLHALGALTPAQLYARALDSDEVLADSAQQRVVELLQARYVHLLQHPPQRSGPASRLLSKLGWAGATKAGKSTRGLYLWGGVGRGKTMIGPQAETGAFEGDSPQAASRHTVTVVTTTMERREKAANRLR